MNGKEGFELRYLSRLQIKDIHVDVSEQSNKIT